MIARDIAPHENPRIRPAAATIVYAPPDALRVARALMGLTQTQAAAAIRISRVSLNACETGSDATLKTIAALRGFYEGFGIIFLGRTDWTTKLVHGSGACLPRTVLRRFVLPDEANFSAARALLGLERQEVAEGAYLTSRQVGNLENGGSFTKKSHDCLRDFYMDRGVEFLSALAGHCFVGLGVRRASVEVRPPQQLWVNRGDHVFTRIPTVWKRNQYNNSRF
ncbi:helix-turn-helix domain-containing protein [Sinorhizobium fredii]|uniref:helix-turn-helix domain-containing protein n=1 Tax=Rhizobium fredii TaxID=380 RepID=UPI000563A712